MVQVVQIPKSKMEGKFLEDLHKSVFDMHIPHEYFRYDGCLIAQNDKEEICTYALFREISSEVVELAWGGTAKDFRGVTSRMALDLFGQECLNYYENVTYQTHNKNIPMIKLGLSLGYIVVGTRIANNGDLFLILNKKR